MAIDDLLLDGLVQGSGQGVLRLYHWDRPTLSLGHHQHRLEPHWQALVDAGRLSMVRRPSGGRAVLHDGCLTYALHWPAASGSRAQTYCRAVQWLRQALAGWGHPLHPGQQAASRQRSSCFATSTAADLVEATGAKRVGSAQLWRRGHLLQHGTLLLRPSSTRWLEVFGQEPPAALAPLPVEGEALIEGLRQAAQQDLGGSWSSRPLSGREWDEVEQRRGNFAVRSGGSGRMAAEAKGAEVAVVVRNGPQRGTSPPADSNAMPRAT